MDSTERRAKAIMYTSQVMLEKLEETKNLHTLLGVLIVCIWWLVCTYIGKFHEKTFLIGLAVIIIKEYITLHLSVRKVRQTAREMRTLFEEEVQ